jgi:hypothetical protein
MSVPWSLAEATAEDGPMMLPDRACIAHVGDVACMKAAQEHGGQSDRRLKVYA